MRTSIRLIVGLSFIALSLFLVKLSLSISTSNTNYYRALASLSTNPRELPNETALLNAKTHIEQALQNLPKDPNTLSAAGRIDYLLAVNADEPNQRERLLNSSQNFYRGALEQRPYWAYSEVNILFAKHASNEHGSEFQERFSNAIKFAPENKQAIKDLTQLGIISWNKLSEPNQVQTLKLIKISLTQNLISARSMANTMRQQGSFYRICAQLEQFSEKLELCNRGL